MANPFLKIEFSNSKDIGKILYSKGFTNRLYLDANVSMPTYPTDEEGTLNGDNEFVASFQKWQKRYEISVFAQEYLVDALTFMQLHDYIFITLKNNESAVVKDVLVDVTWDDDVECFAEVKISFNVDYVITTGCDEIMKTGCDSPRYVCIDVSTFVAAPFTQPLSAGLHIGDYYFFYVNLVDDILYNGDGTGVYHLQTISGLATWVRQTLENNDMVEIVAGVDYTHLVQYTDTWFRKSPFIYATSDETGQVCNIKGFVRTGDYVQIERSLTGVGAWVVIDTYETNDLWYLGIDVQLPSANTWYFRLKWFIHGCQYVSDNNPTGYSNVATQIIA